MSYKNDLILRAARGEKTERTPIWMMRQAGRVLPEYREVRSKMKDFIEFVKTPERAAEVTIQPIDYFDVDAAIIFSDILTIPEAMGLPYEMVEKRGPIFPKTISAAADLKHVKVADAESDLGYVGEAIKITKKELDGRVPLIGFAGAPWTIFAYMIEGSGSKNFSKARAFLFQENKAAHQLMDMITESTIAYLKMQIRSGADMVQVFDSWAGVLSPALYTEFGMPYIQKICKAIPEVPVTVFAKGANWDFAELNELDCQVIGLDWNLKVDEVRKHIAGKTLQGNLDPAVLYAPDQEVVLHTQRMMRSFEGQPHIANLGHGLYPDLDRRKAKLFVETVKNYGK
ncbi:MAG: uroporphyrinogen decarboxylase [Cyclobacteriaceae bacterium]|nr:uroporphyrinogen decarboxylase [Cyclobacteriaceae bacterium]MCH8517220.1 uroporphyrinogen decarboxylase [Cyclobacteriaceae bacterium]